MTPGAAARIGGLIAGLADILMPERCAGCDLPGTLLCHRCRSELPLILRDGACPRCGAPDGVYGCAECGRIEVSFTGARAAGVFEWPLSRVITLHKDAGELRLTRVMGELAVEAAGDWLLWADAIAPVPTSPGAFARRGFDHGERLAAEISNLAAVPALDVLRARPRRDQRHLSREARVLNASASVRCLRGVALPQRILLTDDVLTTCATAHAAASALLAAGASEVRVLAVARACGGRL